MFKKSSEYLEEINEANGAHHVLCLSYIYASLSHVLYICSSNPTLLQNLLKEWSQRDNVDEARTVVFEYLASQIANCDNFNLIELLIACTIGVVRNTKESTSIGYFAHYALQTVYPNSDRVEVDASDLLVMQDLTHRLDAPLITLALSFLPADHFDKFFKDFLLALYDLATLNNDTIDKNRKEHKRYKQLNELSFHKHLSSAVSISYSWICNCSTAPGNEPYFKSMTNAITSFVRIIQTMVAALQSRTLNPQKKANPMTKVNITTLQSAIQGTIVLERKLGECMSHRTTPGSELDANDMLGVVQSIEQFCLYSKLLAEVTRHALTHNNKKAKPKEDKLRTLLLNLCFKAANLEIAIGKVRSEQHLDDEEMDEDEELWVWRITESERRSIIRGVSPFTEITKSLLQAENLSWNTHTEKTFFEIEAQESEEENQERMSDEEDDDDDFKVVYKKK
jgi:hypothetical protein